VEAPESVSFDSFSAGGKVSRAPRETQVDKLSFTQRFGADLEKRRALAGEISDAVSSGEQTFAEGALQIAGKVGVGGTFDFINQGLVSAFRALPDFIEEPIRSASSSFLETDTAQAGLEKLGEGIEVYSQWKARNPRSARNLESVVNIGLLAAPVKKKAPSKPTPLVRATGALEEGAEAQIQASRLSFIDDLVRPEQTKLVREAQVPRTTEAGALRTKKVTPTLSERAIAQEVGKVKGLSGSKTLQGNFNVIDNANKQLAKKLKSDIQKNDFVYPKRELLSELDSATTRLAENPLIVGDAEQTAGKLVAKFRQFITEQDGKGSGILQARKDFDNWVERQKGTNIFDPKNENALSTAIREVRQTANDFLDRGAKDVGVKESLARQSNLFRALDNIKPKAAKEANNAVVRAWQNVARILPLRGEFNQTLAIAFGIGGLGAAAKFAPFFTKLVVASLFLYGAGRVIMGPGTKKALAKLLEGVDKAIRTTKDANIASQLRADKALLLEILQTAEESANTPSEGEVK